MLAALFGAVVSSASETYFLNALVMAAIVVALYIFVGNSGVLSFGHVSFVALGAWIAGVLSVPGDREAGDHADLRRFLRTPRSANVPLLALAAGVGAIFAFAVGLRSMRLSGLAAGIATFGVLEIVHNFFSTTRRSGPG